MPTTESFVVTIWLECKNPSVGKDNRGCKGQIILGNINVTVDSLREWMRLFGPQKHKCPVCHFEAEFVREDLKAEYLHA